MAVTIIVVRHAKAKEGGDFPDDSVIPLSDEGKSQSSLAAKFLTKKGYKADLIISSDLLRAKQTAHIMADEFRCPVQKDYSLVPDSYNIERLITKIPQPDGMAGADRTVIIVGHDPSVADIVNQMTGKKHLKTGMAKLGAAILTYEDGIELGKGKFVAYHLPEETLKTK